MTMTLLLLVLLLQLTTIANDARCVMMATERTSTLTVRCRWLMIHWFVFDFHLYCRTTTRHCVKLVQFPARRRIVLRSARNIFVLNLTLEEYVATVSPDDYRFAGDRKIVQHIVLETGNPRNNTATSATVWSITGRTPFATTVRVVAVRQCTAASKRGRHSATSCHHSAQIGIVYRGRITAHGNAANFGRFHACSEMPWPIVGVFARFAARRTLPAVRKIVVLDTLYLGRYSLGTVRMRDFVANRTLHQRRRAILQLGLQLRLSRCSDRCLPPTVQLTVDTLCRHGQHRLQTLAHHARLLRPARSPELDHIETEAALTAIGPLAGFTGLTSCPTPPRSIIASTSSPAVTNTPTVPFLTTHTATTNTRRVFLVRTTASTVC
uniref:Putative secreted protein n=1 Tax=Anopheles darlingi TaxID=43151 RepID=A0A2M4D337_ANODA